MFALVPLIIIGIAAFSGAFSALGTPLGLVLAPFTFGTGVALGTLLGRQGNRKSGRTGSPLTGSASFLIFLGVVALRVGVVVLSGGSPAGSIWGTVSADLMLLSVGMAITRLAMMWRGRSQIRNLTTVGTVDQTAS